MPHTSGSIARYLATAIALALCTATYGIALAGPAESALPETSSPKLKLTRTIRTTPFTGSSVSMKDNEGSAYVGRDNSLWMADDSGNALYEVDATSGALKQTINQAALESVTQYGGGSRAGTSRTEDLESLSYDSRSDILYAFSGSCCSSSVLPTVFRLTRQSGQLKLDSYQPLPSSSDNTASAYNSGDGKVYVGLSQDIRTYTYTSNSFGSALRVSNLSGILGMDFSDDGSELYVARSNATMSRVNWTNKSLVPGWTFDLSPFGVRDSRAVVRVGDQFFVSDGYDSRKSGDPLKYAVFVFDVEGSTGGTTNQAPSVDAGPDQGVVLPASASLDGTVSDDGLPNPPGAVTATWSTVSGPGTVTFANASAVDTTASFSTTGTYVLRLTADDGALSTADEVTITVTDSGGGGATQVLEIRVSAGSDDAEQAASGSTNLSSSDLELTTDGTTQQVVGTRFAGLQVPAGATITRAYVQFRTDEVSSGASSITIRAEAADNTSTYQATAGSLTSRTNTSASVNWSPPDWTTVGEAGSAQRTPDISGLIQAVVGRAGWVQGNALALQFSGTGRRTAEAFESGISLAPLLHLEYTTG